MASNLYAKISEINTDLYQLYKHSEAILNHTKYSSLPSDYVELEYIQATGTQYLNSGYIHTANTRIRTKLYVTQDSVHSYQFIFGSRKSSYNYNNLHFATRWNSSNVFCYGRTGNEQAGGSALYNQIIEVEAYQNICRWTNEIGNSSSITSSGTVNAGMGPIGIFCMNQSSSSGGWSPESNTYSGNVKLYEFKIYETDTLVREYIPAKRISDNVIGLYELQTNTFKTNVGSGTFLGGPII